ncbi:hypothetical protein MTO96_013440 [Rhipicephalus appendiculatus]
MKCAHRRILWAREEWKMSQRPSCGASCRPSAFIGPRQTSADGEGEADTGPASDGKKPSAVRGRNRHPRRNPRSRRRVGHSGGHTGTERHSRIAGAPLREIREMRRQRKNHSGPILSWFC